MKQSQSLGTCVIMSNTHNQILLGMRKNSYQAGLYGLPGGRIELNEPILSATAREVKEETGIENLTFSYVGVVRENQGNTEFIHFIFSTLISDQQPELCEPEKCEGWKWIDLDSVGSMSILPGHLAGIELYKSNNYLTDIVR